MIQYYTKPVHNREIHWHYAELNYAELHYTEQQYAKWHNAKQHYLKWHKSECGIILNAT